MKKETAILGMVIVFIVGFIAGAVVFGLTRGSGTPRGASVAQKGPSPEMTQEMDQAIPNPAEVAAKTQALKDIVQKDPKNLSAWAELGNIYFDTNQPQEAIEAYSKYLALKPDNADVRTDMGIMFRKLGDFDRAIKEFRTAAQNDPKHVNSRYNIGIVLLHDKQDIKGAIKAWEDYLKADPNSERANRVRAQMDKLKTMAK
jgi:cytochrome c-type biogenesis protein CcmH/NrfG